MSLSQHDKITMNYMEYTITPSQKKVLLEAEVPNIKTEVLIQDIFDIYKIVYGSRMTLDQSVRLSKLVENMTFDELVRQKQKIIERLGLNVSVDQVCKNLQRIFKNEI